MKIPFNKPLNLKESFEEISQLQKIGKFSANGNSYKQCVKILSRFSPKVILTSSCTAALEMCVLLLNIKKNDEIIMPSFTHIGTANPFVRAGAKPIWSDINKQTKNITDFEKLITSKTKAIIAVHYAGIACEIEKIKTICQKHDIFLIEDNAMGLGSFYNEKPLGSFGDLAVMSFHETKNIHCGEGGALFINNSIFWEKSDILYDYGTNKKKFLKNEVDKYAWVTLSSNFHISELQTAFLLPQLKILAKINNVRKQHWHRYYDALSKKIPQEDLPYLPESCQHNGHLFYLNTKNKKQRDLLLDKLHKANIEAVFHYTPLHSAPIWKGKFKNTKLPITTKVSNTIIRLPLFYDLQNDEIDYIVKQI
ncbi:MAG: dTDP-4-amino-4,6-dideoxygalactose transaminase [Candidatus Cloacimonetes bacterium]|nr:dTDP-4-amino-4,6-dideoxygalactose transaminase [Candidatus Cloacimonadota bacterium]MBT7470178.1 dTDP-4-amino-4,6-dideoxygalactose transaminase [Candidatus Cloacimonadota bacterium]